MILLKNNRLCSETENIFGGELHDKNMYSRARLLAVKSQDSVKSYHPLKQKKVKLHRLKFVNSDKLYENSPENILKNDCKNASQEISCSRKNCNDNTNENWSTVDEVVTWLASIGIRIKKLSYQTYILKNRKCFLNTVLLFANKKRIEIGLKPFYIRGITEF